MREHPGGIARHVALFATVPTGRLAPFRYYSCPLRVAYLVSRTDHTLLAEMREHPGGIARHVALFATVPTRRLAPFRKVVGIRPVFTACTKSATCMRVLASSSGPPAEASI